MTVTNEGPMYGWHKGAPTEADFNDGELLLFYKKDGHSYVHNENWNTYRNMLDSYNEVSYWKRFNPVIAFPNDEQFVTVGLVWTQKEGASLCFED